jgi:hypothetical protein
MLSASHYVPLRLLLYASLKESLMQSKRVELPNYKRHEMFLRSKGFAPELANLPFKWRGRVIREALKKMAWSFWSKVYESIAIDFVREFAARYVPAGTDLSQDDSDIVNTAKKAAGAIAKMLWSSTSSAHSMQIIKRECNDYGVDVPALDSSSAIIARVVDPRWWRRQLRCKAKRAFEAGNIRLGYVRYRGEPYASTDCVLSRLAQNRRNAAALEATLLENENGQQFSVAKLAEKSTGNKAIRRGELMLRNNGFETIAEEAGDEGIFVTWTCPSRFHAVRHDGTPNPKYNGATPREANAYLGKVSSLYRAALARRGIGLYGFRIAEPHHDGCPHWHLLMFIRATEKFKKHHIRDVAGRAVRLMKRYAWRADRGEPGCFSRRLNTKRIDRSIGTASGYLIKYVAKNIDGVAEHKTIEGYTVVTDLVGDVELVPSARVEAWASCWGIRQFQQWGGAPVTVWRELRRIEAGMVQDAPDSMKLAWNAVQKIEGEKRACWASYLRAQGGALVPRKELVITLAKDKKTVIGRYGEAVRETPYGVRCADLVGVVFKSVRHTWTPVSSGCVGAGVVFPWTRVNNCTHPVDDFKPAPAFVGEPDLDLLAKMDVINAWAAVNACPFPRLI